MDEDPQAIRDLMQSMADSGSLSVPEEKHRQVAETFSAAAVSEDEILQQIRATHADCAYILDPHTAVGVAAARDMPGAICLATAHPAKFD